MATSHRSTDFPGDRRSPNNFFGGRGGRRAYDRVDLARTAPRWEPPAKLAREAMPLPTQPVAPTAVETRRIGRVDVQVSTRAGAVQAIASAVEAGQRGVWGFCNAHTVNMARTRADFRAALTQMTLFNDGVGVDMASRLLHGSTFPENLNGTDLTPELLRALPAGTPVFLLGSAPGIADTAAETLSAAYPGLIIAGTQHGFFAGSEEEAIVARIAASGAKLVLVAMGHPMQELVSTRAARHLAMPLLCVGAFLDFTAGKVARAPQVVRRLRLEWVWRLACEPRRLAKRYLLGNGLFLASVLWQRMRQRTMLL